MADHPRSRLPLDHDRHRLELTTAPGADQVEREPARETLH